MKPKRQVTDEHYLLAQYPSLAPEIRRLKAIVRPVAGPPTPPAEQLLLVPPAAGEGRKSRLPRRRRAR